MPALRSVPNGELLSGIARASSFSCGSSIWSVRRRRRAAGGVLVEGSFRGGFTSVGESGPLPAKDSLVSRRLAPGRGAPEVLTMDKDIFLPPEVAEGPSLGLFIFRGEFTDDEKSFSCWVSRIPNSFWG